MAATLLTSLKQKVKGLTLVPAGGGCFEVTVNGELIYSKLQTGTFPDEQSVLESVRERLKR
ncbi:SelT/SelW/SelH family protein [Gemmata obscuriglobus]|uniref:SelT/SelW/SelH family protein n=1 Tax=Gemmata obscuriglobus TaxID=114 RepID=A0A2Z3H4T5_9BACT|nr:SelT/SelW/SelH family protein [Gemmata obscuriglobus]